jgi:hypothetical protein
MANLNPLEIQITDVIIQKFNFSDKLSLMPQFIELTVYQSIFEPVMKAEMLINDSIGLFANYPFTGEEIVTIRYRQLTDVANGRDQEKEFKFIIRGVRDIAPSDRTRTVMFIVDLTSVEFLQNTRKLVSHAYNDRVEDMAEQVYREYILDDTLTKFGMSKPFKKEETIKVRNMIVPNLRPFQGIQWLAKHAVAKNNEDHFTYLFFENTEGFNFVTIQQLIEDAKKDGGRENLRAKPYKFISNVELSKRAIDINQDLRLITNIVFNKRFSSIEKIAGGYYQNELLEVSMVSKGYKSTVTELDPNQVGNYTLERFPLNTKEYINYVKNKPEGVEYANRVRYMINNWLDYEEQNKDQPNYRLKFGNATKYMYALNQIDISITVPANMELKAGQIIYCEFPETHGFNNVQIDKYITGLFLITEVKQVLSAGNIAATTLRINRDGYLNSLFEQSLYNAGEYRKGDFVIDPKTGRVAGSV